MAHHHHHDEAPAPASRDVVRALGIAVAILAALTVAGLVWVWPREEVPSAPVAPGTSVELADAVVVAVTPTTCGPAVACNAVEVDVTSGTDAGERVALTDMAVTPGGPQLAVGDRVVISRVVALSEVGVTYSFQTYQRSGALWVLALGFAVFVVAVARWRGVGALAGLVVTWLVLVTFLIPAILTGQDPVAVGITASALIMFVVLYLAHGINARTTTALLGTLVSLGLIGLLSWLFVEAAHLTGVSSDEAVYIQANSGITIDLSGLLLCSIIIGSLGVLNDVTVTQASSVWEIHGADRRASLRSVYAAGMRVGRDHIASTVDTLVLAYAGASLPLLILFALGNQRFANVVTSEIVAEEIVRTLVGSIGLVASVPLTTGLAALVVARDRSGPDDLAVPDLLPEPDEG